MLKEEIIKSVKKVYSKVPGIKSVYLYGSILSNRYNSKTSDVDILFICSDSTQAFKFLQNIKNKSKSFKFKFDLNIVFYSEFIRRWHIYRPPTYFIGIKMSHELILGEDLIQNVKNNELKPLDVYKRIVDLSQGIRGVYINSKNDSYWKIKYKEWLKIAILEILYLHKIFDLNFKTGSKNLVKMFPYIKLCLNLNNDNISIEELCEISEIMRLHMIKYFIKK